MLESLRQIAQIPILFIDWERTRSSSDSVHFTLKNNIEIASVCSSSGRTFTGEMSVSVWRSIFLINKWITLSTKRKINYYLLNIFMLAIFEVYKYIIYNENYSEYILINNFCRLLAKMRFGSGFLCRRIFVYALFF